MSRPNKGLSKDKARYQYKKVLTAEGTPVPGLWKTLHKYYAKVSIVKNGKILQRFQTLEASTVSQAITECQKVQAHWTKERNKFKLTVLSDLALLDKVVELIFSFRKYSLELKSSFPAIYNNFIAHPENVPFLKEVEPLLGRYAEVARYSKLKAQQYKLGRRRRELRARAMLAFRKDGKLTFAPRDEDSLDYKEFVKVSEEAKKVEDELDKLPNPLEKNDILGLLYSAMFESTFQTAGENQISVLRNSLDYYKKQKADLLARGEPVPQALEDSIIEKKSDLKEDEDYLAQRREAFSKRIADSGFEDRDQLESKFIRPLERAIQTLSDLLKYLAPCQPDQP